MKLDYFKGMNPTIQKWGSSMTKSKMPVLATLSVQIPRKQLNALREAAMIRRRERERPFTQQGIVEEAIRVWLKKKRYTT